MSDVVAIQTIPARPAYYADFQGVDRSLERIAAELRNSTPLWECWNATCDWRGTINREPAYFHIPESGDVRVRTVKFINFERLAWAEENDAWVALNTDRQQIVPEAFLWGTRVNMTVFQGQLVAFGSGGQQPYKFTGTSWDFLNVSINPAFGVVLQNRLFVAGIKGAPTEVQASRVNDLNVFPAEEPFDSSEVTKAAFIDIRNLIGTADEVTALGAFELNRLAIFTNDQALIYIVDPDFSKWQVDQRANIRIGCLGPNAIANVEGELFYCSRFGVHAISRSDANGLTLMSMSMSLKIEKLYRQLVLDTPDRAYISCAYDQDDQLFHVFFPRANEQHIRLTLDLSSGFENPRWTTSDSLWATCGDQLAGRFIYGTPGGLFEVSGRRPRSQEPETLARGQMRVVTPILWHRDPDNTKQVVKMRLIATGQTRLVIRAYNEQNVELTTLVVDVEAGDALGDIRPDVPLTKSFELPFPYRYRGVWLSIETDDGDTGDCRIIAFSFDVRQNQDAGAAGRR